MSFLIAIAGKGGTGKTTFSGLIVNYLIKKGKTPILAIDADPSSNLNEVLGEKVSLTIGELTESLATIDASNQSGVSKIEQMEYKINSAIVEGKGFDLLAMGRPEGPGCYCHVNHLLKSTITKLTKSYPYIVVDNEAGMEHLSRRTTGKADLLLIISDPSPRGIEAAARIKEVSKEVKLDIKKINLIINRVMNDKLYPESLRIIEKYGLELAGTVPLDETIMNLDGEKKPIFELPQNSIAYQKVFDILDSLNIN